MNYQCDSCNDTGSRDKLGTYLDCNVCDTAATRRDLNDFVKSLGPTHPEDVALAIHQRALAMAPKQEAKEGSNKELRTLKEAAKRAGMANHFIDGKLRDDMFVIGKDFIERLHAELEKLCPPIAAPAAANGALTDEQIDAAWDSLPGANIIQGQNSMNWNSLIRRAFARAILTAAGPDAALVKALENLVTLYDTDEGCRNTPEYIAARAALSGAKGN